MTYISTCSVNCDFIPCIIEKNGSIYIVTVTVKILEYKGINHPFTLIYLAAMTKLTEIFQAMKSTNSLAN